MITKHTFEKIARRVDQVLTKASGEQMGFVVLAFRPGQARIATYVSNCDREDMIEALEEAAARLRKQQDKPTPPTSKRVKESEG